MAVAKISCIYLKKQRFCNNGTSIYLKYAVLTFKMSSLVKFDPVDLTASRKHSWSQNLKSLPQKTKIWHNYVFSRRFGKYSFPIVYQKNIHSQKYSQRTIFKLFPKYSLRIPFIFIAFPRSFF